jgi:hypothetical protein
MISLLVGAAIFSLFIATIESCFDMSMSVLATYDQMSLSLNWMPHLQVCFPHRFWAEAIPSRVVSAAQPQFRAGCSAGWIVGRLCVGK